ncbi:Tubulin-specific chaperone c, partial [Globisporangium splendens]
MADDNASTPQSAAASADGAITLGMRCELLSSSTTGGLRASIKRYGEVAYIGAVQGLPTGEWIGVRLDKPLGKNDGSYDGMAYFACPRLHGAFVRKEKLNTVGEFPILVTHAESIEYDLNERRKAAEDKKQLEKATRELSHELNADDLVQSFWKRFIAREDEVRRQIGAFVEQKKQPMPCDKNKEIQLNDLVLRIGEMRDDAASAASMYLSPYDIRQSQIIVSKLLELVETTRTTFAPRKKFTFRARAKKTATKEDNNGSNDDKPESEGNDSKTDSQSSNLFANMDELVYANRQNEVIIVDQQSFSDDSTTKRRDLNFSHLTNCTIFVCVETSAIRGDDLKQCTIYTSPVWGSVWLENCVSCEFFVACRQLRVHLSHATTFHLRISSHPIIEDCHQMKFGPYRLHFDGLDEQLEKAGLLKDNGLWSRVNDFKWHKAQQSPNWSICDPKQPLKLVPARLEGLISMQ